MPPESDPDLVTVVELLLVVLGGVVLVKRVRIPHAVALVRAGLAVGVAPQLFGVCLTPALMLTIFLPVPLCGAT